ncbi:MAG: hypothetical protein FJ026_18235, partial [Chloroflexi bacterium]|nr:hypothetical protein [Chloroflexota bacterium]
MQCPRCQYDCPAEFAFCPQCGTPLSARAVMREMLPERIERLIPKEYAERLLATRGQPHDERRTVTILFSDIKGSTTMVSQLDPEEAKEIILG